MGEGDIVAGASCAVLLVESRASSRSASFASVPDIFAARDTVLAVRYSFCSHVHIRRPEGWGIIGSVQGPVLPLYPHTVRLTAGCSCMSLRRAVGRGPMLVRAAILYLRVQRSDGLPLERLRCVQQLQTAASVRRSQLRRLFAMEIALASASKSSFRDEARAPLSSIPSHIQTIATPACSPTISQNFVA